MKNMAEKTRRWVKLIKHVRKLKKMLRKSEERNCGDEGENLVSSPLVISCDELFIEPKRGKDKYVKNNSDDSFMASYIAAQRHFTLRPNIYI